MLFIGKRSASFGILLLPLPPIDRRDRHRFNRALVQTAGVDAVAVGVRAWDIERLHTANRAEEMPGDFGIEGIGRESLFALKQPKARFWNDEMKIPEFGAHRAIAVDHRYAGRRGHFEPHSAAVASSGVGNHVCAFAVIDGAKPRRAEMVPRS